MLVISGEQKGKGVKGPKKNQGWSRMARRGDRRKAEGGEGVAERISRAKHSRQTEQQVPRDMYACYVPKQRVGESSGKGGGW